MRRCKAAPRDRLRGCVLLLALVLAIGPTGAALAAGNPTRTPTRTPTPAPLPVADQLVTSETGGRLLHLLSASPPPVESHASEAPLSLGTPRPTDSVQIVAPATATSTPTATPSASPTATETPDLPTPTPTIITRPIDPADEIASLQAVAQGSSCGVPWQVLAAIAKVESNFGRNMNTSTAGAIGYGQFLPDSWTAFGQDGDPYDYHDALPAMARYLCGHGADNDLRSAIYAYNHADWYVDLVLNVAIRYGRARPGDPTTDIIDLTFSSHPNTAPHYAQGRDTAHEDTPVTLPDGTRWLSAPYAPSDGAAVSPAGLAPTGSADLAMALAGLGRDEDPPGALLAEFARGGGTVDMIDVADRALRAGLTPVDEWALRSYLNWTPDMLRWHIAQRRPVVVRAASADLPGHPSQPSDGDTFLLITGVTPDGFVYNDPSFGSDVGYGLLLSEEQLRSAWADAQVPHQGMALSPDKDAPTLSFVSTLPVPMPDPVDTPTPLAAAAGPLLDPSSTDPPAAIASADSPAPAAQDTTLGVGDGGSEHAPEVAGARSTDDWRSLRLLIAVGLAGLLATAGCIWQVTRRLLRRAEPDPEPGSSAAHRV